MAEPEYTHLTVVMSGEFRRMVVEAINSGTLNNATSGLLRDMMMEDAVQRVGGKASPVRAEVPMRQAIVDRCNQDG